MNHPSKPLSPSRFSDNSIFLLISAVLAAYLVVRAILVPMAHDEIATFYYFVQSGKVSPFLSNIDTNNHFLNSLLTWVFYGLFGPTPLVLRLSNLIFIPVFFLYLYKITKFLRSRILKFAFFISLAFSLHFIEFLALSRGYGISMAMLTGSLFYLMEGNFRKQTRPYVYSLIFIFIACTANLALINTYALILLYIIITLIFHNLKNIKPIIAVVFAGIVPISIVILQILYIKLHAGLIAGSPEHFWSTTIITLFAYLFETSHGYAGMIAAVLFSLIAISGILAFYRMRKLKFVVNSIPFLFTYLFAGNIAVILVLGIFFKVNYPDDRIGLYLYPLSVGSLIFILDYLNESMNKRWTIAMAVPFLLIPLHFFMYMNTSYSIWYKYDVIPARFYTRVMQNHKAGEIPPTMAGHGMRIFCWSYLDYLHGGVASPVFFTHFPDYNADFQIVNLKMIPGWQKVYDTIDYDPVSERHLLKLRKPYLVNMLLRKQIIASQHNTGEFVPIGEGPADTLRNKNIRVDFNFALLASKKPFNSRIVFDVGDKQEMSLRYEYIQFSWLRNSWGSNSGNFSNCMLVYKVPAEAKAYKIYIWNIDKTEFDLNEGSYTISELR